MKIKKNLRSIRDQYEEKYNTLAREQQYEILVTALAAIKSYIPEFIRTQEEKTFYQAQDAYGRNLALFSEKGNIVNQKMNEITTTVFDMIDTYVNKASDQAENTEE